MKYAVDIQSLRDNFPSHFEVPTLLIEFAEWLSKQAQPSVGYFRLQSDRCDDYWIENGADLHPYFAFFIRDCTGGQIGYWLYQKEKTKSPPIVLLGSEGETHIVGNSLMEFLQRLAEGKTRNHDLDSDESGAQGRKRLAKWLDSNEKEPSLKSGRDHPDLTAWIKNWGQVQRERSDNDPLLIQIADKLRKYVKPGAESWERAAFDVLLIGSQFSMWHRSFGPQPMPAADVSDLESLFRSVREQRAKQTPERGLWFTAWVTIGSEGSAVLSCDFMDQPKILDEIPVIPVADYLQDLAGFPRSPHWMPKWLEAYIRRSH